MHPPVGLSVSLNPGAPDGLCSLSAWQASEACGLRVRVCSVGPDTTDCSISTWLLTQAIWELLQRSALDHSPNNSTSISGRRGQGAMTESSPVILCAERLRTTPVRNQLDLRLSEGGIPPHVLTTCHPCGGTGSCLLQQEGKCLDACVVLPSRRSCAACFTNATRPPPPPPPRFYPSPPPESTAQYRLCQSPKEYFWQTFCILSSDGAKQCSSHNCTCLMLQGG